MTRKLAVSLLLLILGLASWDATLDHGTGTGDVRTMDGTGRPPAD